LLAVDVVEVAGAEEVDPEFDVEAELAVDVPPSDEADAAADGFSDPPPDSVELAAGFEPPLAA